MRRKSSGKLLFLNSTKTAISSAALSARNSFQGTNPCPSISARRWRNDWESSGSSMALFHAAPASINAALSALPDDRRRTSVQTCAASRWMTSEIFPSPRCGASLPIEKDFASEEAASAGCCGRIDRRSGPPARRPTSAHLPLRTARIIARSATPPVPRFALHWRAANLLPTHRQRRRGVPRLPASVRGDRLALKAGARLAATAPACCARARRRWSVGDRPGALHQPAPH